MLFFVTQIKYLSYYLAMQSKVKFKKIEDSRKLHTYCTIVHYMNIFFALTAEFEPLRNIWYTGTTSFRYGSIL